MSIDLATKILLIIRKIKFKIKEARQPFVINCMELCVSTKCTLKCKECWHLIPNYLFRGGKDISQDFSLKSIYKTIKALLNAVDIIYNFGLLGGEPFLYKDLDKVIEVLIKEKKVKKITIVTNGTLVPNDNLLKLLRDPKIFIELSDYGDLSTKKEDLIKIFSENNIAYKIRNCYTDKWFSAGEIVSRHKTDNELTSQYKKCWISKCQYVINEKFYMCPRCGNLHELNLIPDNNEYIHLTKNNRFKNRRLLKKLFDKKFLSSCNYCNSSESKIRIPAAEQYTKDEITNLRK